jgi:peptidyl-tRNA hydrolase, PTH1 family
MLRNEIKMKVIFAQGNPGQKYAKTRHNTGFMILDRLAANLDAKWSNNLKFRAQTATVDIDDEKVLLVKPVTFYNETGNSARAVIDFYKLNPINDLLVIHDDLALSFGVIRIREKGSGGGNNGVKSINSHIGENYWRIRIGVGNDLRNQMDDADFVLSKFSQDESEKFQTSVTTNVVELIDKFCKNELKPTSTNIE